MVTKYEGSTLPTPKLSTGDVLEPVPSTPSSKPVL
jgi:hypothetical protein